MPWIQPLDSSLEQLIMLTSPTPRSSPTISKQLTSLLTVIIFKSISFYLFQCRFRLAAHKLRSWSGIRDPWMHSFPTPAQCLPFERILPCIPRVRPHFRFFFMLTILSGAHKISPSLLSQHTSTAPSNSTRRTLLINWLWTALQCSPNILLMDLSSTWATEWLRLLDMDVSDDF